MDTGGCVQLVRAAFDQSRQLEGGTPTGKVSRTHGKRGNNERYLRGNREWYPGYPDR